MKHFYLDEVSSVYSDVSTASATFSCGDNMGCGTTTDESDDDSISKEKQVPAAKKLKVDVKSRRCSERLKQAKDSGDGTSGSHSSQQIKQTKRKHSGRRGGKQGKTSLAKLPDKERKEQRDSKTGY